MEGDRIIFRKEYEQLALDLLDILGRDSRLAKGSRYVIAFAGESGCGKSVTSRNVARLLEEQDFKCMVLSMDDFFRLPPQTNHYKRLENIAQVGPAEIHLEKIQSHIDDFHAGADGADSQMVFYGENRIAERRLDFKGLDVLLIEGTFAATLQNLDRCIFLSHSYRDTRPNRLDRGREEESDFIERVLDIEHRLIREHIKKADIVINARYEIEVR